MATSEREIHSEAVEIKKQQPTNSAKVTTVRSGKRWAIHWILSGRRLSASGRKRMFVIAESTVALW